MHKINFLPSNHMSRKSLSIIGLFFGGLLFSVVGQAHCPLCTAGAGVAALGAAKLGVGPMAVGVFLGAFAVAIGLWVARLFHKEYVPKQKWILVIFSYVTTIYPLKNMLSQYSSIYIPFWGEYGKTFLINLFIVGGLVGAILLLISPMLSRKLVLARNGKMIPFQGMLITFGLLIAATVMVEVII